MRNGRILVGIIGAEPAEAALRYAFTEAEQTGTAVTVIAVGRLAGADEPTVGKPVWRWARNHPAVECTLVVRRTVDAVVTLAAASRHARVLIVQDGAEPRTTAMVTALTHRAHCDVVVAATPAKCLAAT